MSFYDGSTSSIVGLVFICIIGFFFSLMILGCIIIRCNSNCKNIFYSLSRAQDALAQSVQRKRLRLAAHRGGSINHAENSLGAFQFCVKNGVGLLEMDLCESKDGQAVVCHDHELARVVDPAWLEAHPDKKTVSDCYAKNPDELPPYASTIRLHFPSPTVSHYSREAALKAFVEDQRVPVASSSSSSPTTPSTSSPSSQQEDYHTHPSVHRLCTLKEVLDFAPRNVALHIDIKQGSKSLVKATVDLIAAHPRSAPTIILGAGGNQNYVDLQRRLGRSRGFRCCSGSSSSSKKDDNDDDDGDWYNESDYCDEYSCSGCCVCCCCCCGTAQPGVDTNNSKDNNNAASTATGKSNHPSEPIPGSSSSQNETVALLAEPNRRPLIFASGLQVVLVYVFYLLGILPYIPLNFDVFSIPAPTSSMKDLFSRFIPSWLQCLGSLLEAPALWSYLRGRGICVFGWVLNSEKDFEEASKFPFDGIMTDDVPLLASFYEKNPNTFLV